MQTNRCIYNGPLRLDQLNIHMGLFMIALYPSYLFLLDRVIYIGTYLMVFVSPSPCTFSMSFSSGFFFFW